MKRKEEYERKDHEPLTPEEFEAIWEKAGALIIREMEKDKRKKLFSTIATAVVISAGVSIASYNWLARPEVYMAEFAPLDMTLKDGTHVRLLHGARLTVEKSFPGNIREVQLEGSAIFRVSKQEQHPFIVHGVDYDTRVLGTVFKVVQDKGSFKVDLYEGKVAVNKNENKTETYTLHPQETFNNYGAGNIAAITPLKEKVLSGNTKTKDKDSEGADLQFKECRLEDVLKVIEQVYQTKVSYPREYKEKRITISFKDLSADMVLQSIALSMRLQLQQHDTIYQLEK
ncbi:FecR family protein [Chryseobacterium sp. 22543]|uniref:FecR family protein n=1 Tax=Chryseobacterium sp. 22543 TaxID=3453940 RepID=UPI003F8361A0